MSQASYSDQLALPVRACDHIQGSITAPIVLVEYGDYQCPNSGRAYSIVQKIQQRLDHQLCFVFRHFPLAQIHPQAQITAEAAEVAGEQGKFWQMHNTLFQHQQALADADLVEYAVALGLNIPRFLRKLSGHIYAERVQEDLRSGVSSGVSGTPTFFINGVCHHGAWNLERLLAVIEQVGDAQPR